MTRKPGLWAAAAIAAVILIGAAIYGWARDRAPEETTQPPVETDSGTAQFVWGVDSASAADEAFCDCVAQHYGTPAVFGRYLETKENVSAGLTKEEAELLHSKNIKIIPIYNHFTEAVGYQRGVEEAKIAVQYAQELGVPRNTALFADIEPNYPVDASFILGWSEYLSGSPYYPGIYGVFKQDSAVSEAFLQAVAYHPQIADIVVIWSSTADIGVTGKEQAPAFQPNAPEGIDVSIWQYGIDGEICNIDTNLVQSAALQYLW